MNAAIPVAGSDRPFHRRIRLPRVEYERPGAICSVTIGLQARRPIFSSEALASAAVEVLASLSSQTRVPAYAYCVMPDHVHLLIGPSEQCDITSFVARFKSLVYHEARKHGYAGTFWQRSFWDHFLRADEQVEHVAEYVLNNPVRKGLVGHWWEYPFAGSLVFDLRDIGGGGQAPALQTRQQRAALNRSGR